MGLESLSYRLDHQLLAFLSARVRQRASHGSNPSEKCLFKKQQHSIHIWIGTRFSCSVRTKLLYLEIKRMPTHLVIRITRNFQIRIQTSNVMKISEQGREATERSPSVWNLTVKELLLQQQTFASKEAAIFNNQVRCSWFMGQIRCVLMLTSYLI